MLGEPVLYIIVMRATSDVFGSGIWESVKTALLCGML